MNYHRLLFVTVSKHIPPHRKQAKAKVIAKKKAYSTEYLEMENARYHIAIDKATYIFNEISLKITIVFQPGRLRVS